MNEPNFVVNKELYGWAVDFTKSESVDLMEVAVLQDKSKAERLCQMCNDGLEYVDFMDSCSDGQNKRIAILLKTFCLQENLTFKDLGFTDSEVKQAESCLLLPVDLRAQSEASRNPS